MGAELRIESEEVVRLAEELAALRKMSVPDAVAEALRKQVEREREAQERKEQILAAAAAVRESLIGPLPGSDHSWLYDENGLPA